MPKGIRTMKTLAGAAAALALLLSLAGCRFWTDLANALKPIPQPDTTQPQAKKAKPDAPPQRPWISVMLLDANLPGLVTVESSNVRRAPSGLVEAWALLRNLTNQALQLEARVQFFNQRREPVEGPTAWTRLYLPPHGRQAYRGRSSGAPGIALYYIEVRAGR